MNDIQVHEPTRPGAQPTVNLLEPLEGWRVALQPDDAGNGASVAGEHLPTSAPRRSNAPRS